ncbi:MAG TPA: BlaI/MecI/CopY family transcriptional regulator, partial [Thermoanaerobaculia bacterium]|nr:BlaI/MecI/CopY family transcriptional regulator [Thermoanaerobaculia bacterium]
PPKISGAEWEVMTVLWKSSPRSASDVIEELQWHPKTVKTLLARLVRKGALRYREEGNRYLYRPTFARERYVEAESRSFIARVFGGSAAPALVHFVETLDLTDDDVEELRAILDRKQKEDGR